MELKPLETLRTKIFADGADKPSMLEMYRNPFIQGFTTNPTLMRKAGVKAYKSFALEVLRIIKDKPLSFEVFSDDFDEMYLQALEIANWGKNVYVKIPVMNTKAKPSYDLIHHLANKGVKQNITALMTLDQVKQTISALHRDSSAYLSVFAGRIADTGRDPVPMMHTAVKMLEPYRDVQLIWASPRELLNIFQADSIGCHVITATYDILKKISLIGKDLREFSLETVKMFYDDAMLAGYSLEVEMVT